MSFSNEIKTAGDKAATRASTLNRLMAHCELPTSSTTAMQSVLFCGYEVETDVFSKKV